MGALDGKVTIVTGGSGGLGACAVRRLVREGSHLVIADVDDQRGDWLARDVGPKATYVRADVRNESEIQGLIQSACDTHGRLDCLINNAGIPGASGNIEHTPTDEWDETIAVLFRSVFLATKHAAPIMKRQNSGSIVNMASVAGLHAGYGPHAYSAAKAAVIQLTRSLALELGPSGVRVNCICPGFIMTPLFARACGLAGEQAEEVVPKLQPVLAGAQPLPRAGTPTDVAEAALWLASDASSFVNGHTLVVDGGMTAGRSWQDFRQAWSDIRSAMGVEDGTEPGGDQA